jgi:hypothetical protein
MRRLNRITEEFVRCHRLIIQSTGNDPGRLALALDKFPNLAASIKRLHQIEQGIERFKSFGKHRFIIQAHPEFRGAVKDFHQRWARAGYNPLYKQAALRVSQEFMRCYRLLIERTFRVWAEISTIAAMM